MSAEQVERIDAASMDILETVGVLFRDPIALDDWKRRRRQGASASGSISTAGWCAS